jgi:Ca2+-binding EF-hand superfamily protein
VNRAEYERKIATRFASFDLDQSGFISREDFQVAAAAVLAEFGEPARSAKGQAMYDGAEALWQGMAGMADRDGDQRVSREEFVEGAVKRLRDNPRGFIEIARPFHRAMIAIADADGDGAVSVQESERVLRALGVQPEAAALAAAALDGDGDGRIAEDEILAAFAAYFTMPERTD